MGPTMTNRRGGGGRWSLRRLMLLVGALAVLMAACSTNDDDSTAGTGMDWEQDALSASGDEAREPAPGDSDESGGFADDGEQAAELDMAEDRAGGADENDGAVTAGAPVVLASVDLGRSIVYTAVVDIEVDDVPSASRQAQQAVAGAGGVVFSQDTTSEPRPRTTLVFKVPPEAFGDAMERLEGIGTVVGQEISADDVTERVVDLQSRILTSEASVERLRDLLAGATTVEAIASLEGQLLERETNLEVLRGQLRTLQSQVALATITVTITEETPPTPEPAIAVVTTAYVGDDDGDRCPGELRLDTDEGESVVVCVAIANVGNVDLTEIEVRDLGLDLRRDDFTLIDFAADDVLAPEETLIAWARFDASPGDQPRPSVTAVPVDDDGDPVRHTLSTSTEEPMALTVVEDDSLPGLGDSLSTGWGAVEQVVGVAIVALGTALPFLVLAAIPVGIVLWQRRRETDAPIDDGPAAGAASPA
jgi:hypothetical protein